MVETKKLSALPWGTAAVALLALGVYAIPSAEAALIFERDRLQAGQAWRLWTAHFVHFGASHLFWNLAVFLPAAGWLESLVPARARWFFLLAPASIGVALYLLDPTLQRYAGLSGVVAGTLALLALTQLALKREDRWFWRCVIALLALKILAEYLAERPVFARFAAAGTHAVPLAHLVGVALAVALHARGRWRQTPSM